MQHSEKQNVKLTKDRIFNRFMLEHSANSDALKDHPKFSISPLEKEGTISKLALLQEHHGFYYFKEQAEKTIKLLCLLLSDTPDVIDVLKVRSCIDTQFLILDLFAWLEAYGPAES